MGPLLLYPGPASLAGTPSSSPRILAAELLCQPLPGPARDSASEVGVQVDTLRSMGLASGAWVLVRAPLTGHQRLARCVAVDPPSIRCPALPPPGP
jgi:hypothetical protein